MMPQAETAAPVRRKIRRPNIGLGDVIVWGLGITLAVLALWLPWDAYFNSSNYSRPTMQFSRDGEVPADIIGVPDARAPIFDGVAETFIGDPPPRLAASDDSVNPFERDPLPPAENEVTEAPELPEGVDPITTQTVGPTGSVPGEGSGGGGAFTLVQSQGRSALIADEYGIYLIRPGAMLPDGRRIVSVTETDDGMVVETSGNGIIELR